MAYLLYTVCVHFGLNQQNMKWIDVKSGLPKHLEQCAFKLDNGDVCIGKCKYFEYGDSELIEMYGKGLSYLVHSYRNWELHNFDRTKYFKVTHWASLAEC